MEDKEGLTPSQLKECLQKLKSIDLNEKTPGSDKKFKTRARASTSVSPVKDFKIVN
jgi:hypothetical protein